jgi:DNA-directed RNA polymerase specialized sigma subunit
MSVSGKVIRIIKEYFKDCRKLRIQKERVEFLEVSVQKAKDDIKNANVFMETDLRAMRFDSVMVQTGMKTSPIDIELSKSSDRLMATYSQELKELSSTKRNVFKYEKKVAAIGLILKSFDEIEQRMISMRFQDSRSFNYIGDFVGMSESSAKRNIDRLVIAVAEDLGMKEVDAS